MKTYAVLGGEAVQKIYLTPPLFFAKFRRRGGQIECYPLILNSHFSSQGTAEMNLIR